MRKVKKKRVRVRIKYIKCCGASDHHLHCESLQQLLQTLPSTLSAITHALHTFRNELFAVSELVKSHNKGEPQ